MIYLMILANILLLVAGQLCWKLGLGHIEKINISSIIQSLFTPYIFSGILLYGIATLLWLWILAKAEFSMVYPLQSLAYALGVVVAIVVFKEDVSALRWIGVATITLGAVLVAKG